MSFCSFQKTVLIAVLVLLLLPGASAWTFTNWSVTPSGSSLVPGTPVSLSYNIHFDSWMTGSTFEKDNTLLMATDLSGPKWTVKKVEPMENQEPVVEALPGKQGAIARFDGWVLSYSSKRFDLVVVLEGKVPSLNETATINLVRVQEQDANAKTVYGTTITKEVQVVVITPVPTPVETTPVTLNMTPAEYIEITPEPTQQTTAAPEKKQIYSPGPSVAAVLLCLLAGLVLFTGTARKR